MDRDTISKELRKFQEQSISIRKDVQDMASKTPLSRARLEVQHQMALEEEYRVEILKTVKTFGKFSMNSILS